MQITNNREFLQNSKRVKNHQTLTLNLKFVFYVYIFCNEKKINVIHINLIFFLVCQANQMGKHVDEWFFQLNIVFDKKHAFAFTKCYFKFQNRKKCRLGRRVCNCESADMCQYQNTKSVVNVERLFLRLCAAGAKAIQFKIPKLKFWSMVVNNNVWRTNNTLLTP